MSPDRDTPGSTIGPARSGDVPAAPPGLLAGIRQHGLDDGRSGSRIISGIIASSIALIGFGLDSVIELACGLWGTRYLTGRS
jgi:hypothetical protein